MFDGKIVLATIIGFLGSIVAPSSPDQNKYRLNRLSSVRYSVQYAKQVQRADIWLFRLQPAAIHQRCPKHRWKIHQIGSTVEDKDFTHHRCTPSPILSVQHRCTPALSKSLSLKTFFFFFCCCELLCTCDAPSPKETLAQVKKKSSILLL